MKKIAVLVICLIVSVVTFGQVNPFEKISFIIGDWTGTVSGSDNSTSKIESSFQFVKDGKQIQVSNDSQFESVAFQIKYDIERQLIICNRIFINEGCEIKFFLDNSLSTDTSLVFMSEHIENLPYLIENSHEHIENLSGGKARWTIKKISENEYEDSFEVSFPREEFKCLRSSSLIKKQ